MYGGVRGESGPRADASASSGFSIGGGGGGPVGWGADAAVPLRRDEDLIPEKIIVAVFVVVLVLVVIVVVVVVS